MGENCLPGTMLVASHQLLCSGVAALPDQMGSIAKISFGLDFLWLFEDEDAEQ